MLKYGPTGALSEYAYKGGAFHGVHYGDFHDDSQALFELMNKEEEFLLKSHDKRRILMDFYHMDLTPEVLAYLMTHLEHIASRIHRIAFATDEKSLRKLDRALKKASILPEGCYMLHPDQDTDKTWLVAS